MGANRLGPDVGFESRALYSKGDSMIGCPWWAWCLETTSWPIPYWVRRIGIREVDRWFFGKYPHLKE